MSYGRLQREDDCPKDKNTQNRVHPAKETGIHTIIYF